LPRTKGYDAKRIESPILLKADVSEAGEGWRDNQIIEALATSASMVYEGFEAVLSRKPRGARLG
jgi:hypothetical protein